MYHVDRINFEIECEQFASIAAGESPQALYVEAKHAPYEHGFVSTWPGTPVLVITKYREWRGYTPTGGYFERCHVTGRDLAGRMWRGFGLGRGMLCRMSLVSAES